jgi:hypothetical protein
MHAGYWRARNSPVVFRQSSCLHCGYPTSDATSKSHALSIAIETKGGDDLATKPSVAPAAQFNAALRRIIGEPRDFRYDSMV